MALLSQRILVAFMACWLPFCCCQARVAANALVHLSHTQEAECCTSDCCGSGCCDSQEAADHDGCCGGDGSGTQDRTKGSCCVLCKERALPPATPSAVDEVSASAVDFVATALLADSTTAGAERRAPAGHRSDGGPPPRPSGRRALCVHSVLVI